jgi:hypothetical protein
MTSLESVVLAALAAVAVIVFAYYRVKGIQNENINQWLLGAVIQAERDLGSGTGKYKLRVVYDTFIVHFGILVRLVPFATFSAWVDAALAEMKTILENNVKIKEYIEQTEV